MGATRALVTVKAGTTYINDKGIATACLSLLAEQQSHVRPIDEIDQRVAIVEAGMVVQQKLGGFSTPLATAIRALRSLNGVVNEAKHEDAEKD